MNKKLTRLIVVVAVVAVAFAAYYFISQRGKAQKAETFAKQKKRFDQELQSWINKIHQAKTSPKPIEGWEAWWEEDPNVRASLSKEDVKNAAYYQMMVQRTYIPDGYEIRTDNENWYLAEIV